METLSRSERGRRIGHGYTLIELLVVLGILGLLMSWVAATTHTARARARLTVCVSNMRQLLQAAKLYEADYEGLPVHFAPGRFGWHAHWHAKLQPYVRDRRIFICPSDPSAGAVNAWGGWPSTYGYLYTSSWLGPNMEYRTPAPRSMLIDETDGHRNDPAIQGVLGRYDGSVELIQRAHYRDRFPMGLHFEPEDGLGPHGRPHPL